MSHDNKGGQRHYNWRGIACEESGSWSVLSCPILTCQAKLPSRPCQCIGKSEWSILATWLTTPASSIREPTPRPSSVVQGAAQVVVIFSRGRTYVSCPPCRDHDECKRKRLQSLYIMYRLASPWQFGKQQLVFSTLCFSLPAI